MALAKLNIFQRLVRQWDTVHPYNGGQVLHLAGNPDLDLISDAWWKTIIALQLGPVRVAGKKYEFQTVDALPRISVDNVKDKSISFEAYLSDVMNKPFPESGELPFRPFVFQSTGDTFYLGVIYQHWIADSSSIQLLLKEWFQRIYEPQSVVDEPVTISKVGYWAHFGPKRLKARMMEQMLSLLRAFTRLRRAKKLMTKNSMDFNMACLVRRLPEGIIPRLLDTARRNGATLNDLFLMVMSDVADRFTTFRSARARRDLALGTIVDLRPHSVKPMDRVFGLYLGYANVVCTRRDLRSWPRLIRHIAAQTRIHKQVGSAQTGAVFMAVALATGKFIKGAESYRFYRNSMPLSAGISNINMNQSWAAKYYPDTLIEYIRISPTGPIVPLVFTTTTVGNNLLYGMTYRCSLYSAERAQQMASLFEAHLIQLAECGDALLRE